MTVLKLGVVFGLLILQYQNCSSYNDPSPFELASNNLVTIPANKVFLDQASDPGMDNRVSDGQFTLQMDGACNVGAGAVSHYIEFEVSRLDGGTYTRILEPASSCSTANQNAGCIRNVQCEHGRYHVLINGQQNKFCPPTGVNQMQYRLRGQLVTVNAEGDPVRASTATMERVFLFSRLTSVCGP